MPRKYAYKLVYDDDYTEWVVCPRNRPGWAGSLAQMSPSNYMLRTPPADYCATRGTPRTALRSLCRLLVKH